MQITIMQTKQLQTGGIVNNDSYTMSIHTYVYKCEEMALLLTGTTLSRECMSVLPPGHGHKSENGQDTHGLLMCLQQSWHLLQWKYFLSCEHPSMGYAFCLHRFFPATCHDSWCMVHWEQGLGAHALLMPSAGNFLTPTSHWFPAKTRPSPQCAKTRRNQLQPTSWCHREVFTSLLFLSYLTTVPCVPHTAKLHKTTHKLLLDRPLHFCWIWLWVGERFNFSLLLCTANNADLLETSCFAHAEQVIHRSCK